MSQNSPAAVRLMLILPADIAPAEAQSLAAAGDVAAVILRLGSTAPSADRLRALAAPLQAAGCAVLLEGPAALVQRAKLDGAHVEEPAALADALGGLKPQGIVGAGGLTTRHAAMEAGESGADYVLFGTLDGQDAPADALVEWWSALFEVPCVAVAGSLEGVGTAVDAGADFVALAGPLVTAPDAQAQVRAAQARVAAGPIAAPPPAIDEADAPDPSGA